MNDYKELIDGLQRLEFFNQRAGRELWADKPHDVQERDIESAQNILLSAIGTIEQLVKERDYEREAADEWQNRYLELARKCSQLEKERDAAEPVRHGHWIETIEDGKMKRVTSCCGDDQTKLTVWYKPDYCPNCGAKMRGTEDE